MVEVEGDALCVGCGGGSLLGLDEVQMEGKRRMSAAEFLRGNQVRERRAVGAMKRQVESGSREEASRRVRVEPVCAEAAGECGADGCRLRRLVAKITPARLAAFEILKLVGEGKGHSDELLHSARVDGLSPEDRNLTTALVMGVLRWQIALDARVRRLLQRPEQRLAEPVAIALRMGAFQLLHLDRIPAHAALSESVELCRAAGEPHAAGMVNAVLRKVADPRLRSRDVHPDRTIPLHESAAAFAERLGHPLWMVERWVKEYGREAALKICEADQREPAEGGMFAERGGDWPHDG